MGMINLKSEIFFSGITHDFDERGLHVSTKWLNCIYIPLQVTPRAKPLNRHITEAKGLWSKQTQKYVITFMSCTLCNHSNQCCCVSLS